VSHVHDRLTSSPKATAVSSTVGTRCSASYARNDNTAERRYFTGVDGGKSVQEQGELFGIQNIFRFDPEGFVPKNVRSAGCGSDDSAKKPKMPRTDSFRTSSRPSMRRRQTRTILRKAT